MSSRHQRFEEQLLGPKGSRFISRVFLAITGYPLPAEAAVIGMPEYQFEANEIPPGHKTRSMWLDFLFVILSKKDRLTVGIEIKTDEGDLLFDAKLPHELVTDYFFLAVPSLLIPAALFVINHQPDRGIIGIVNLDNSEIVVMPSTNRSTLQFFEVLVDAIQRQAPRLEIYNVSLPRATYVRDGFICVNRDYCGVLALHYRPQLPRLDKCYDRYQLSPLYRQLLREARRKS